MGWTNIGWMAALIAVGGPAGRAGAQAVSPVPLEPFEVESEDARFRVEVVASGLRVPWGIAFLPDGRLLVTERPSGRISVLDPGTRELMPLEGVPAVFAETDGGMLDVAVHPEYERTGWIYYAYAAAGEEGATTVVERARLRGYALVDRETLFTAEPWIANGSHFGSRLALAEGYLFVTLGERDTRELAQDLSSHHGKIVRLHDDGRVPADNPFVRVLGARPEIWTTGHRNPQGLAFRPGTTELWSHEHGPRGGDEVNVVRRGGNYGWPRVSYGLEYSGEPVGQGLRRADGLEPPLWYYRPSIAPSGMTFYQSGALPGWRGDLFVGALAERHLNRLVLDRDRVIHEERLLADRGWRVRVVREGPDGWIYVGVDEGLILRLGPVPAHGG